MWTSCKIQRDSQSTQLVLGEILKDWEYPNIPDQVLFNPIKIENSAHITIVNLKSKKKLKIKDKNV